MKLSNVNPLTTYKTTNERFNKDITTNISFKGGPAPLSKEAAELLKKQSWIVKTCVGFKRGNGEFFANLVNNGSKALIAPFIIAFNPFSKESQDTKTYSAWKQPIEAAVAVLSQFIAIDQVEKFIDWRAKTGKLVFKEVIKEGEKYIVTGKLITNKEIEAFEARLKPFKERWSFFAALAMIPIVTSIVNWVYPKIMEKIMPETVKAKKVVEKED